MVSVMRSQWTSQHQSWHQQWVYKNIYAAWFNRFGMDFTISKLAPNMDLQNKHGFVPLLQKRHGLDDVQSWHHRWIAVHSVFLVGSWQGCPHRDHGEMHTARVCKSDFHVEPKFGDNRSTIIMSTNDCIALAKCFVTNQCVLRHMHTFHIVAPQLPMRAQELNQCMAGRTTAGERYFRCRRPILQMQEL